MDACKIHAIYINKHREGANITRQREGNDILQYFTDENHSLVHPTHPTVVLKKHIMRNVQSNNL